MLNKKGQVYLIAAVVIIGIIIAFATLTNTFRKGGVDEKKVYFLSDELDIESAYVIDYSVFKVQTTEDLLLTFTEQYGTYAGEQRDIYFVFGNENKIIVATYEDISLGSISINTGTSNPLVKEIVGRGFKYEEHDPGATGIKQVTVKINQDGEDIPYTFDLKEGENFYFVISQDIEGRGRIVLDKPASSS